MKKSIRLFAGLLALHSLSLISGTESDGLQAQTGQQNPEQAGWFSWLASQPIEDGQVSRSIPEAPKVKSKPKAKTLSLKMFEKEIENYNKLVVKADIISWLEAVSLYKQLVKTVFDYNSAGQRKKKEEHAEFDKKKADLKKVYATHHLDRIRDLHKALHSKPVQSKNVKLDSWQLDQADLELTFLQSLLANSKKLKKSDTKEKHGVIFIPVKEVASERILDTLKHAAEFGDSFKENVAQLMPLLTVWYEKEMAQKKADLTTKYPKGYALVIAQDGSVTKQAPVKLSTAEALFGAQDIKVGSNKIQCMKEAVYLERTKKSE